MCICMCVYMCTCLCVHVCIYACVYVYTCICVHICLCVYYMCVCIIYIYVCMFMGSMCICMCVWMCMHTRLESVCYNILDTLLSTRNTTVNKINSHLLLHRLYNFSESQFEDLKTNSIWAYSGLSGDHLKAKCCCEVLVPTVAYGHWCPGIK